MFLNYNTIPALGIHITLQKHTWTQKTPDSEQQFLDCTKYCVPVLCGFEPIMPASQPASQPTVHSIEKKDFINTPGIYF